MRKYSVYAVLFIVVCIGSIYISLTDEAPQRKQLITSEYLIQEQLNNKIKRRKNGYAKQDKPDKYLEYIHKLKTGGDPDANYPINNALNELKSAKQKLPQLKASNALDWKQRGPGNVGGRTRGLVIDPDDVNGNTWFTGPVAGGVWKTTDAGETWNCLTIDWPNLSVSSLVMADSNHDVMYAGTGEGFGNLDAIKGNGIFKTTNRGASWVQLASTANSNDFSYVNRLIVDPSNESIVIAVTNTGIFRTSDGGTTWNQRYVAANKIQDIIVNPTNFDFQFASDNNAGILTSVDGGVNWKLIKKISSGRIELCISNNFPNKLFALTSKSELYFSNDGGDNWKLTTPETQVNFLSGQGWYNNTLVTHPTDENKLFVGGIDLHSVEIKSEVTNGETKSDAFDIILSGTDFLSWKNIDGEYLAGAIKVSTENSGLFTDVEILFGPGVNQKAHRFTTTSEDVLPEANDMNYVDYVDVPFRVTDKSTGQQLMVSFRDDNSNGVFDLTSTSLEQIYIHNTKFNETPSTDITAVGGIAFNKILTLNPVIKEGAVWDPTNLPESSITLDHYTLKSHSIASDQISVWWPKSNVNYSHADHHNLAITQSAGNPFRIVNCNDGGVFISDDGGVNWDERVSGYVTTQFYGISKHPTKDIYLGGTQDNGTWVSVQNPGNNSDWTNLWGGDGFETVWHATDPNKMAMSIYNNEIKLSYDGGASWNKADIGDVEGKAPFVTRISNVASNPELLFVGGESGVWRSEDFGKNWNLISMPADTWNYGNAYPHIEISPVNSNYVWAGNAISSANDLAMSTDGGKTFVKVKKPNGIIAYISELVAHPTKENGIYVLFAQNGHSKIIYTEDNGENWTDLTQFSGGKSGNGFPNVAVYSLVVMPYNTDILWAGTEIGIFESTDGGLSWHFADKGLPAVCIWDMKIVGEQLVVGTHGLGVWTLDITELIPPSVKAGKTLNNQLAINIQFSQAYDVVELFVDKKLEQTYNNVSIGEKNMTLNVSSTGDYIDVQVRASLNGFEIKSDIIKVENYKFNEVVQRYTNAFSINKSDFSGSGFKVSDELFGNWAIHSEHPYAQDKEITYTLLYPIEVLEDAAKAKLSYRDIALIETGEAGSQFGSEDYHDYVIVEASKDGINWYPLDDGYDVNYSSKWINFASNNSLESEPDDNTLFEPHTVRLHSDQFGGGDIILVRFRMYSNEATIGWGWVIDDLIIQETGTSTDDSKFTIGPNPATNFITLDLTSKDHGDVRVSIYDMSGRLEQTKKYFKSQTNWKQTIDTQSLSSGMKVVVVTVGNQSYKQKIITK